MRGVVVANPKAGTIAGLEVVEERLRSAGFEVVHARAHGEAGRLAAEAEAGGAEIVAAAGGDGTVREVASAVVQGSAGCAFGILPLGTGNDLARTLGIPLDVEAAADVLVAGEERRMDALAIEPGASLASAAGAKVRLRHAFNVVAAGFSGQVADRLTGESKARWGALAYLLGLVQALPEMEPTEVTVTFDEAESLRVEAFNVIVANGRSVAGGRVLAPDASIDDGQVDVLVIRHASLLELSALAARLALGSHLDSDLVTVRRARAVRVASDAPLLINVDGELETAFGMGLRVLPGALRVVVPGSRAGSGWR